MRPTICVYVCLVAIVKKRLAIKASLYEMLQIFEPHPFRENTAFTTIYRYPADKYRHQEAGNQLRSISINTRTLA